MAVGDIFRVTIQGKQAGETWVNVMHYRESATGVGNAETELADSCDAVLGPAYKTFLSHDASYDQVAVQRIDPLPVSYTVIDNTNAGIGLVAQDMLPPANAMTVTKKTAYAGRKYRGRVFLPGIPKTYTSDGGFTAGGLAAGQLLADDLKSPRLPGAWTFTPILWHRSSRTYTVLTDMTARQVPRVQRRREHFRGV